MTNNWLAEYIKAVRTTEGRKPNKAEARPTEAEWRKLHPERGGRRTSPSPGSWITKKGH